MVYTLIDLVQLIANVYSIIIVARVILSWFMPDPSNPLVGLVYRLTEPVMAPVRSLLPAVGGFDFSPILVLFGIQILERVLIQLLVGLA